jgi:hypothetical protein
MSELYDKIKDDVGFRRIWAEKWGVGFDLPANVPMIPNIAKINEAEKAA